MRRISRSTRATFLGFILDLSYALMITGVCEAVQMALYTVEMLQDKDSYE